MKLAGRLVLVGDVGRAAAIYRRRYGQRDEQARMRRNTGPSGRERVAPRGCGKADGFRKSPTSRQFGRPGAVF